jgi:hypothetical protein
MRERISIVFGNLMLVTSMSKYQPRVLFKACVVVVGFIWTRQDSPLYKFVRLIILTPCCSTLFEKPIVKLVKEYPAFFMESEGSLQCSQKSTTGPCPESTEFSSPHLSLYP